LEEKMKIGILSRDETLYSTQRLLEAAQEKGHETAVIDYLRCSLDINSKEPRIIYKEEVLEGFEAIIPRIGTKHTEYGTAVIRQFESMSVFSVASSMAIQKSRDKLQCLQLLNRKGIQIPRSSTCGSDKDIEQAIEIVGGCPLIGKIPEGTQGTGVMLLESKSAAKSIAQTLQTQRITLIAQEFLREAEGADIRCLVVGKKVVAAMKRQGTDGEFRSNLHQGGVGEPIKLSAEERKTAIKAAQTVGLKVAGVDLIRTQEGSYVIEINSSPGLEGIETVSQINVASKIISYIESQTKDKEKAKEEKELIAA
jgi:ribosomal protein S6--L-glutamate ligase